MNYKETVTYLQDLPRNKACYGIDQIRVLAGCLGSPQEDLKSIHVAGTNGKGSVCSMLDAVYRSAGYRVGLFTSPHLVDCRERIQVDGKIIPQEDFMRLVQLILQCGAAMDEPPSFFEVMTAMAFLFFKEQRVDVAIFETGLGGEFDATNILNPKMSIITHIGLDHVDVLGDSLAKIAKAKAGIIKDNVPLVIGGLEYEAEALVREIAQKRNAKVYSVRERFTNQLPETNLQGAYQQHNAAAAQLAAEKLNGQFPVLPEHIDCGLQQVPLRGRWEQVVLEDGRRLILDTTHNLTGFLAIEANFKHLLREHGKVAVVIGFSTEARAAELVPHLLPYAKNIYCTHSAQGNALDRGELRSRVVPLFAGDVYAYSLDEMFAFGSPIFLNSKKPVVVIGSTYLVGEVLALLEARVVRA